MERARSWWGWGWRDRELDEESLGGLAALLAERFGVAPPTADAPVDPAVLEPPRPRVAVPDALAGSVDDDPRERFRHAHGCAFREVVRALHGDIEAWPDLVVRPRDEGEVAAVLDWASDAGVAVVPWGGGTSVVGGVRPPDAPCVSLDLGRLDGVVEVDDVAGLARVQAGALGPRIEAQLRDHDLTLRHFPQSWEFSTLGGWLATCAGGHHATGPTRIDDHAQAITALTPSGRWSSLPVPSSGAGPSPDRWLLGSEGSLGVITEAWMRVSPRPRWRASATVELATFGEGLDAVRAIVQDGLRPANARLLDPEEAALSGAGPADGTSTLLVLGVESPEAPRHEELDRLLELAAEHGGRLRGEPTIVTGDRPAQRDAAADRWRSAFLEMPYMRDGLARLGAVVETFETAVGWAGAEEVIAGLRDTARRAASEVCGDALVTVRTTHAYPDGIAPYLTVVAPGPGLAMRGPARGRAAAAAWDQIKVAVTEALTAAGATVTHHHAVGRDHLAGYRRQRPEPFARALAAVKRELDPAGVCNPGVLIEQ